MSLYFAPAEISRARLEGVSLELQRESVATVIEPGVGGFVWIGTRQDRFGPARDNASGVRVVCSGQLAFSAHDWARAERLPYEGGLACRLILERYLRGGAAAVVPYNGSAVIVIHDPRDGNSHVYTDQFGYHPCFLYRGDQPDKCTLTTFPDALLVDPDIDLTLDLVSMAEFMRAWRATPPHTYYTEVKHAGAAAHITINARSGRTTRRTYWTPFEHGFYPSLDAAAEELAGAVRTAIYERTSIAERPAFFISGGADSRVLLFCAADRGRVTGINLYERAAQETDIAKQLCEVAGSKFLAIQRDNDYYPRNLVDIVRWSGAMWCAEDTHYSGFADHLAELKPDLVMTACTTDWLFKGYGLEKWYRSMFGRYLPFLVYTDERVDGFLPNVPLPAPPRLEEAVNERLADWFEGCPRKLLTPLDRLRVEDRRVRPTAYTVSVSGQVMYRTFPYDTFLADSRIAECYSRTHPDWKLNREVWGKAAAMLCKDAGSIVDANYGWRVDASMSEKAVMFAAGWLGRRLRTKSSAAQDEDRPPSSGSWPELGWYALHSPTLKRLWQSVTTEERERMAAVCVADPWDRPLDQWAKDGNQLFRVLTLLVHWREIDRRRNSARLTTVASAAF